jgi:hypothetical protein
LDQTVKPLTMDALQQQEDNRRKSEMVIVHTTRGPEIQSHPTYEVSLTVRLCLYSHLSDCTLHKCRHTYPSGEILQRLSPACDGPLQARSQCWDDRGVTERLERCYRDHVSKEFLTQPSCSHDKSGTGLPIQWPSTLPENFQTIIFWNQIA